MKLFDRALARIKENMEREYNCIPFDSLFPKFSEYLPGITQKTYYIITASSKAGKSQLTDFMFLYHPYQFVASGLSKIKLKIFYYSLEMDIESKMVACIGKALYEKRGITVPIKQLLSQGKNRVQGELWETIIGLREHFEALDDVLTISDAQQNPTGIYKQLWRYAENNGKILKKGVPIRDPDTGEEKTIEVFDRYVPNNPDEYVLIITDHLSELSTERGWDIKATIEKYSDYNRILRNHFGYIPIDVQQQSASGESITNFKFDKLEPTIEGMGESKLTARKANVIIGLYNPFFHEKSEHNNYNIRALQDNYRSLSIIRQRNGESAIRTGLYFNGAVNYFRELPKAKEMTKEDYLNISKI